jgi:hypothetical protein
MPTVPCIGATHSRKYSTSSRNDHFTESKRLGEKAL